MSRPRRLVLDTNVVISAALWGGRPGKLIELAGDRDLLLFTSRILVNELGQTLSRAKLAKAVAATGFSAAQIVARYQPLSTQLRAPAIAAVSRDPDDDHVLACAQAARADMVVSGDDDLLVLESHHGIPILRVADALAVIGVT